MQQAVKPAIENDDELVARIAARDHAAMRLATDQFVIILYGRFDRLLHSEHLKNRNSPILRM